MRRSMPWVIALLCLAGGIAVWTLRVRGVEARDEQQAVDLVRRAYGQGSQVPLRGEQELILPGPDRQKIEVTASVVTDGEGRMRIEYLDEPLKGVTIWEDAGLTYRFNPAQKRLTVAQTRKTEGEGELLLENYTSEVVGRTRVAERPAVLVLLRKAGSERTKRLTIDSATYVILATQDSLEGRLLRSSQYRRIEYLSQAPSVSEFRPPEALIKRYATARVGDSSSRFSPEQLSSVLGWRIRLPEWLPPGFTLEGVYQAPCSCPERHQAARLEFSDGLSAVTLFQCGSRCESGTNCFGPALKNRMAVGRMAGGLSLLAVGDLPEETLQQILDSVPAQPPASGR